MSEKVAVVGLGYVGLPLSLLAVSKGFDCIGIDTNPSRVNDLLNGKSFSTDISNENLKIALTSGFSVTDSFETVAECEVIVVCVPTPLDIEQEKPDLSLVLGAVNDIAKWMRAGSLVVLESTVAPGTTGGPVLELFLAHGLKLDEDFYLAYSPERINPGSASHDIHQIPKIVSGCSPQSLRRAAVFYDQIFDEVVTVAGTKEAEFAKLLENTYRLVNVSLVNELALAARKMGIDFQEVTRAASSKPYGFQPFFASAGAGGHCIPVDPVYLYEEISMRTGDPTKILNSAIEVNRNVPKRIIEEVLATEHPIRNKRILVVGLAYKPGISDIRNSASLRVIQLLIEAGAMVEVYDPLIEVVNVGDRILRRIALGDSQNRFDLVLLMHPQDENALELLKEKSERVYTTCGRFGEIQ